MATPQFQATVYFYIVVSALDSCVSNCKIQIYPLSFTQKHKLLAICTPKIPLTRSNTERVHLKSNILDGLFILALIST